MTERFPIGEHRGITLEVAAWDGVAAEVDLSAACLFSHEPPGHSLGGGALHLDHALDGALTRLRREQAFEAKAGETLLLRPSPPVTKAPRILIVGLGPPEEWRPARSAEAAALAIDWAVRLDVESVAFAPSLLDAGMSSDGTTQPMLAAVVSAIDRAQALADERLTSTLRLRRFVFDAGAAHAASAASAFQAALPGLAGPPGHQE